MEKTVKTAIVAQLLKVDWNQKDIVTIIFQSGYDQLVETIQVLQMLNTDINLSFTRNGQSGKIDLGFYRYDKILVNNDGTSKITFKGVIERPTGGGYAKLDNLVRIQTDDKLVDELILFINADVQVEEEIPDIEPGSLPDASSVDSSWTLEGEIPNMEVDEGWGWETQDMEVIEEVEDVDPWEGI